MLMAVNLDALLWVMHHRKTSLLWLEKRSAFFFSSEHYENDMYAKSAKYMLQTLNIIRNKPYVQHYYCP